MALKASKKITLVESDFLPSQKGGQEPCRCG